MATGEGGADVRVGRHGGYVGGGDDEETGARRRPPGGDT